MSAANLARLSKAIPQLLPRAMQAQIGFVRGDLKLLWDGFKWLLFQINGADKRSVLGL